MDTKTGINECQAEQPAAILIDPEKNEEGQCEGAEHSRSLGQENRDALEVQQQRADGGMQDGGSLGHENGYSLASVNLGMDHEATSERAGRETRAPTRTSPSAPPLLCHSPPQQWSNFGLCLYTKNFDRRKFD
jgi:hypothetical protein